MNSFVRPTAVALALVLGAGLAACGDDDDETTEDAAGDESNEQPDESGESSDYCDLAAELDQQEDFPSVEQLEALRDAAPDEIAEDVDFVADAFIAAIEDGNPSAAFAEAGVEEAFVSIEAYEGDECGLDGDGDDGDEEAEQDPSVTKIDPDAARIDVSASEYTFEFDAPEAGRTSFVMTNDGEEPHFMLIGKLADGVTLDEALQSEDPEADGLLDPDFTDLESDIAGPGEEAVLTADLEPGNYGMLCFLPGPDGTPHAFSGMAVPFTVG